MNPVKIVPGALTLMAVVALFWWARVEPELHLEKRVPGQDVSGDRVPTKVELGLKEPKLETFDGTPADLPGAWPGFRGAGLDLIAAGETGLLETWPAAGPEVLWSIELGEGYASPAVLDGRVFVLDYDHESRADALRCLSLADGREIWRYSYPVVVKRNHGMSRTIPTVTAEHVVSFGPKCHVTCCDTNTGELRWQLDLVKDFGAEVPLWYAGQCPLVDGDRVILATGGEDLVMAVDIATGKVIWRSPNPRKWVMTHSSLLPIEFAGRRMYVYCASGGVVGVSAEDGAILWETEEWKISIATVPSPVDLGEGRLFFSGGYNAGSLFLDLRDEGGTITPVVRKRLEPEVFGSTQQTPILYEGHLYGVRPPPDSQLVCLDLDGNEVWASGAASKFGIGPYLIAGGMIFVMNDTGLLTLARASPDGYEELAAAQVLEGHDSWGPLALAGGRLLARDLTRMVCLDVKEN